MSQDLNLVENLNVCSLVYLSYQGCRVGNLEEQCFNSMDAALMRCSSSTLIFTFVLMKYSYVLCYILVLIYCSLKIYNHVGWRIGMNGFTICSSHCFLCCMIIFILVIRYHGSLEYMNFDSHHPTDMHENVQSCFHSKWIEVARRFLN